MVVLDGAEWGEMGDIPFPAYIRFFVRRTHIGTMNEQAKSIP